MPTCLGANLQWSAVDGMPEPSAERAVTFELLNWESPSLLAYIGAILVRETLGIHTEFSEATSTWDSHRRVGTGEQGTQTQHLSPAKFSRACNLARSSVSPLALREAARSG